MPYNLITTPLKAFNRSNFPAGSWFKSGDFIYLVVNWTSMDEATVIYFDDKDSIPKIDGLFKDPSLDYLPIPAPARVTLDF